MEFILCRVSLCPVLFGPCVQNQKPASSLCAAASLSILPVLSWQKSLWSHFNGLCAATSLLTLLAGRCAACVGVANRVLCKVSVAQWPVCSNVCAYSGCRRMRRLCWSHPLCSPSWRSRWAAMLAIAFPFFWKVMNYSCPKR
eukprot:1157659-Pelagomonas_calceolata.AAC.9